MSIAPEKNTEFASMNNQLLNGDMDEEKNIPKRNSKDDLITKLTQCCEENNIKLEYSNTKLRRMGKTQLQKLLAEKIEIALRNNMSAQVGAPPSSDTVVALGALRMIHDLCAVSAERGLNVFLPKYGYEVDGFASSLKEPHVQEAVDMCLEEIARETDVLQYIQSPWARLGIAWSGALMTCIRRKEKEPQIIPHRNRNHNNKNGPPSMGPRPIGTQNPLGSRLGGRPTAREELRNE
tara:strand:- start:379 stop:1086 length:708 start_codon:yes stop_codon:yes gene_type:complete